MMKKLFLVFLIYTFFPLQSMEVIPIRTPEDFETTLKPYCEGDQSNIIVAVDIDKTIGEPAGPPGLTDEAYKQNKNLIAILTAMQSHNRPKSHHAISRHGPRQQDYLAMHRKTTLLPFGKNNTIPKSINELLKNKVRVWFVTNRDPGLNEQTRRQLAELGILLNDNPTDFHTFRGKEQFGKRVGDILFCANNAKGPMFDEARKRCGLDPDVIVVADDKLENLSSFIETFPDKKVIVLHMQLDSPMKSPTENERLTRHRPTINVGGQLFVREWIDPSLQQALKEGGLGNESTTDVWNLGRRRRSSDDLSPTSPNSPPPTCPPEPPDLSLLWDTHFKK